MSNPAKRGVLLTVLLAFGAAVWAQDKPLILSTFSVVNDMARSIGGDNFVYSSIVPIGTDPYRYEPTAGDVRKCNEAAALLRNGLGMEIWLSRLIANSEATARLFDVTENIVPIKIRDSEEDDPHAWMSAANGLLYCQRIRDAFIEIMPEKEQEFRINYQDYSRKIEDLDQYITRKLANIPDERRILITPYDAFQYFGRRYNIQPEAIPGSSTDADVQRLTDVIDESQVPAVFRQSATNAYLLEQIAERKELADGGVLYALSVSDEDGPARTYLKMLRYNADIIYEGLVSNDRNDEMPHGPTTNWLWGLLLAPIFLAIVVFLWRVVSNR